MVYHSIIVGAGISGLYIGYQLLQKGITNFVILEKGKNVGGRIYTNEEGLELGASIIHTRQKNIMKIIYDLGLSSDLTELKRGKETLYCGSNYKDLDAKMVEEGLKRLDGFLEKKSFKNPLLSLQELCKKFLNKDEYNFYKDFTKEWYEYREQNCVTVYKNLKNVGRICKLKGGLSQIIDKFQKILGKYIKTENEVQTITYIDGSYQVNDDLSSQHLYLCTNIKGAKSIRFKGIQMKDVLKMCKGMPCIRVYYKFYGKDTIDKSVTGNHRFKWCIYISDKIVMGSYTDGPSASYLGNLGEKMANKLILKELGNCLDKEIRLSDVEKTYFAFWKEAYAIVKSHVSKRSYEKVLSLLPPTFHQTVCPLEYGLNQAWMEAHLLKI